MEEAENLIHRFLSYGGYFDTLVPSSLFGTAAEEVINLFGLAMWSGVRATDLKRWVPIRRMDQMLRTCCRSFEGDNRALLF
jgi:hypothetical protein